MRVSYLWLKDLLDFSLSPEELAHELTMVGSEVESLTPVGPDLTGVIVGYVLEVNKHPNADKLSLCKVDLGAEIKEVICGAPNVAAGQKIAFAGIGVTLPNGLTLDARKIRGVTSTGMICSARELQLNEDHTGIMVLREDALIGQPLQDYFGTRDYCLELEITLNRPDCLSHVGIAREIAAALKLEFTPPSYTIAETGPPIETLTSVEIEEPDLCPRYSARVIQGVKVGPSPAWMVKRLEAVGLRSINNVVDITNFVMMQMGHPMHAFDYHHLEEHRVVVKCAEPQEKFVTLDEVERQLDSRMLLICDGKQGVAIAGVMGGLKSEITDATVDLLLESAYFDPVNTRRTSNFLNLTTDSSKRFERGADPNATVRALDMAAALIVKYAGGKVASGVADAYPRKFEPWNVELRPARVTAIVGIEIPTAELQDHLRRLGCQIEGSDPIQATIPTFRFDLEREIDLIEEVARLHGYNQVPTADRANVALDVVAAAQETFEEKVCNALVRLGFNQVKTSPLIAKSETLLRDYPEALKLRNPGSEDMAYLCNGLLPGLLKVAAHNLNRDNRGFRIFESGRVFHKDFSEKEVVAGLMVGVQDLGNWDQGLRSVDFLDLKGAVESLLQELSLDKQVFVYYTIEGAGRFTADVVTVMASERQIGLFGQLHPKATAIFDIDVPIFGFEFDVAVLQGQSEQRISYKPFSSFPALQRDLAFVVAESVTTGQMSSAIIDAGGDDLIRCELFDVYRSDQLGADKKSLAFSLNFQSFKRTLTDDEADLAIKQIMASVDRAFGAVLRS
ncbi:MAG: phenylalanine--tRNA ligase subunit beta [bacterium]